MVLFLFPASSSPKKKEVESSRRQREISFKKGAPFLLDGRKMENGLALSFAMGSHLEGFDFNLKIWSTGRVQFAQLNYIGKTVLPKYDLEMVSARTVHGDRESRNFDLPKLGSEPRK